MTDILAIKPLPSLAELKEFFMYEPETGKLFWKKTLKKNQRLEGVDCGYVRKGKGYREVTFNKQIYQVHRIIWLMHTGQEPTGPIDHKNGIRSDNRISNLRAVTQAENTQNRRKAHKNSATGLLGVYKDGRRFWSTIMVHGKTHSLGRFDTAEEAHVAYVKAKRELHSTCMI